MFDFNHYYLTDHFGVGATFTVQYQWVDDTHTAKRPAGVVLSITLFTRLVEFALWW